MEAKSRRLTSADLKKLFPQGIKHADVRFIKLNGKEYLFSHTKREHNSKYDDIMQANGYWWGIMKNPRPNDLDLVEPINYDKII